MRYLCRVKQNLSIQDQDGNTALHHACKKDRPRMVYNLLIVDSDRTIKNKENMTPYDISKLNENLTIMNLFVSSTDITKLAQISF